MLTFEEVQRKFDSYQLTRNTSIACKFADNKKMCALDDISPEFVEEILEMAKECYDEGYQAAINDIFHI